MAQMTTKPLLDEVPVSTTFTLGKHCRRPVTFDLPVIVSDMSFGSLSKKCEALPSEGC